MQCIPWHIATNACAVCNTSSPERKYEVSLAEYGLFYRALLQKRPINLRSLLIVATPYPVHPVRRNHSFALCQHTCVCCARVCMCACCVYGCMYAIMDCQNASSTLWEIFAFAMSAYVDVLCVGVCVCVLWVGVCVYILCGCMYVYRCNTSHLKH